MREAHFEISIQHVCGDLVLRTGEMEGEGGGGRVRRKGGREGEKKRSGKGGK